MLQLRAASDYGDAQLLRQRIKDLLDRSDREAVQMGATTDDTRYARFALIAFIDETILSSDWMQKNEWIAKPLQLEFYNRYDAGEEFFTQLEALLRQPERFAQVLEVFYLCMTLGFKGRYQLHEQERLRMLIEETHAALRKHLDLDDAALSPHGKARDQVVAEVQRRLPAWIVALVAGAIAVLVYLSLSLWMNSAASDAREDIQQIVQTPAAR